MAATDLLTLQEAIGYLQGADSDAPRIQVALSAVSARLDDLCGPIVTRSVTATFSPIGSGSILLPSTTTAITSVSETSTQGAVSALTASDYILAGTQLLRYRSNVAARWTARPGGVTVTYTAGRFANTAAVDPVFKHAAGIYLQHLWRPAEGGGSETYGLNVPSDIPTFGVPNVVRDLLTGYLRAPVVA